MGLFCVSDIIDIRVETGDMLSIIGHSGGCVSDIIATNGNTYTISTLHNTGYTQYQHYQGLTVLCSVIKFHKLIWAPLIHFTSAIGGQIEQSIPISLQTAQGACQSILSAPPEART